MKLLSDNLIDNNLIYEPANSGSDSFINFPTSINNEFLSDVEYMIVHLKYLESWVKESDIFQYFSPERLEKLKHDRCLLFVDISLEGWSPKNSPITISLHLSCLKNGIDPRKIYYLTSNHRESTCYSVFLYNEFPNVRENINVCENIFISELSRFPGGKISSDKHKELTERCHSNKLFLQLSRRNRSFRIMANHQLYLHGLVHHAHVSQDILTEYEQQDMLHEYYKSPFVDKVFLIDDIKKWNDHCLPYTVDYPDFTTNWAAENFTLKYHQTLFSIVLETSADDVGGTSMFLSEKTFKAMSNRHPLIVFGHKGSNHFLRDLGFMTYEKYFDIAKFDHINDNYLRYNKIIEQVKAICKDLENKSLKDRISWKYQQQEILDHNYEQVFESLHSKNFAEKLHMTIKSFFEGNFHSQFYTNPHI